MTLDDAIKQICAERKVDPAEVFKRGRPSRVAMDIRARAQEMMEGFGRVEIPPAQTSQVQMQAIGAAPVRRGRPPIVEKKIMEPLKREPAPPITHEWQGPPGLPVPKEYYENTNRTPIQCIYCGSYYLIPCDEAKLVRCMNKKLDKPLKKPKTK